MSGPSEGSGNPLDAGGGNPFDGGDGGGDDEPPPLQSGGISEPFIRHPVATTLLTVGLLGAGLIGYRQLPVSALPQVDYPTIVVST